MTPPGPVRSAFLERHGRAPRLFRAPGRVNLIGEHTDYNDGLVLPMALERDTVVAAATRADRVLDVLSLNRGEHARIDLDGAPGAPSGRWTDYVEGVARVLDAELGRPLPGADLVLQGDVPEGGGLSSSASLEIAVGLALAGLAGAGLEPRRLARAAQEAEHRFVGTRCGIMDQMVAVGARVGHALLIDCRSLDVQPIPLDSSAAAVLVCDSGVRHRLVDGEYNRRRAECEQALALLSAPAAPKVALRDVSEQDLAEAGERLPPVLRARARHVVTEIARTERAAEALGRSDAAGLGRLMTASHASLRDDYEVSIPELDALVEAALAVDGVLGARMTGGGFGGCTVTLVRPDAVAAAGAAMEEALRRRFGRLPAWFVTTAAGGAAEL